MDFTFTTQLHYLVHFVDGEFVAHCLDMDLVGSGKDEDAAVDSLNNAVRSLVYFALKSKVFEVLSLCKTAPGRYWDMFEEAKLHSGVKLRTLEVNADVAPVTVKECHFTYCLAVAA